MSNKTWMTWGAVFAGSALAAVSLGGCVSDFLMQMIVMSVVN